MPRTTPTYRQTAAVYLPIVPLYGGPITLLSRKGSVCGNDAEADAIIQKLPEGRQRIAEIVRHGDPKQLKPTLALGDVREMLGRRLKVEDLSRRAVMAVLFPNGDRR